MKNVMNLLDKAKDIDSLYWMLLVGMVLLAVVTSLLLLEMEKKCKNDRERYCIK